MAITKYEHPNVSAILVESDVTVPVVTPYTNLFCPIISEKGQDRKLMYFTSPENFIFECGYPNYLKYGQAGYNALNALRAGAGVYVLRCTPEYLDVGGDPVTGSATYANIIIGVAFDLTSLANPQKTYNLKPIIKYNDNAFNVADIESSLGKSTVAPYTEYNFLALYPKGRGESYNNLGVTLVPLQGRYADTYPWYMYSLTVYRTINGVVSKLENFTVSLDPDARSVFGNSYFILDVLEKYSKYLIGSFNQTAWDSIETDIGISASKLNIVEATPFKNDYALGNTYGKKISSRNMTAAVDGTTDVFTTYSGHGLANGDTIQIVAKSGLSAITLVDTYYIINRTATTFKLSLTSGGVAETVNTTGTANGTATFVINSLNQVVYNKVDTTIAANDIFTKVAHGLTDGDTIIFNDLVNVTGVSLNTLYYVVNSTVDTFKISRTLGGTAINITLGGTASYNTRILNYLTVSDTSTDLGFINGSNRIPYLKYGFDGKFTSNGLVGGTKVPVEFYKSTTFDNMMVKAFAGLYDSAITQSTLSEIDLVLDANFNIVVKQSMIEFSQQLRKDCFSILDLNINNTQSDYLDYRQNQLTSANDNDELEIGIPVDTRFVSLISGDRFVFDDITKKNIQVTPTYYLSTIIPSNDKLYGIGKNFVGVNRSVITDYIEGKGSAYPTEPEKEELYNNQVNYLSKTFKDLYFDSQETTLTKSSALGEISKARAYLRIERIAKSVCNRTQWEFATEEVYKNLESSIAVALESFVKDGTCEYIRPRVWADDYAKANKLVYVYVELRFTDIIERVEITFNVAR